MRVRVRGMGPVRGSTRALSRAFPPIPPRGSPLRCHFLLQNLRFETEIGISTAYGCGRGVVRARGCGRRWCGRGWCGRAGWCVCGRGVVRVRGCGRGLRGWGTAAGGGRRVRGWRAGSAARAADGSIRGDGVVLTDERISTDEQVDAVVVLDQQHSIRLGQRRKCRGSHVHARDSRFHASIHRSQRRSVGH